MQPSTNISRIRECGRGWGGERVWSAKGGERKAKGAKGEAGWGMYLIFNLYRGPFGCTIYSYRLPGAQIRDDNVLKIHTAGYPD
jgi:hypothetical protein